MVVLSFLILGLAICLVYAGLRPSSLTAAHFERAGWVTAGLGLLTLPYLWALMYPELMILVGVAVAISGRRQRTRSRVAR